MGRRIKDIVEISEYTSLDDLIERLQAFRTSISEGSLPEVVIRGDDFFGHRLTITYLRELTVEEAALEKKYLASGHRKPCRSARPPSSIRSARSCASGSKRAGLPGRRTRTS